MNNQKVDLLACDNGYVIAITLTMGCNYKTLG